MSKLAGRKQESAIWDFFEHDSKTNKSRCIAEVKGKVCGKELSGKNCTNLKTHLSSFHNALFKECEQKDISKRQSATGTGRPDNEGHRDTTTKQQTLMQCTQKNRVTYPLTSPEHRLREEALLNFIVDAGIPISNVKQDSFKQFCKSMDAKFRVPGL